MSLTVSCIRVLLEKVAKHIDNIPRCGNSAVFKIAKDVMNNALRAFDIEYPIHGGGIGASSNFTITVDGNVVYTLEGTSDDVPPLVVSSNVLLQQIANAASQGSNLVLGLPESITADYSQSYLIAFAMVAKVLNPGCADTVADIMKTNSSLVTQYFIAKAQKPDISPTYDPYAAVLTFWKVMENVIYAPRGSYILRNQLVIALDKFRILEGELKSLVCPKTFWYNNRIIYETYDSKNCDIPIGLYCNSSCDFAVTTDGCEPSLIKAINLKK